MVIPGGSLPDRSSDTPSPTIPTAARTADPPAIPKVVVSDSLRVVQVMDVDLDLDRADEQILITRAADEMQGTISVSVVVYDRVYQSYRVSWEGVTAAQDDRYVAISTTDIVGDHYPEIVCQGKTAEGALTVDVFRKTTRRSTGLSYTSIFSQTSRGDIDIQESPRSQSYLSGLTDGVFFPIVITEPDPESENITDIVRTPWYWSVRERRYVAGRPERIAGSTIERGQLGELFSRNSVEGYVEFVAGSWLRSSGAAEDGPALVGKLLQFDPEQQTVVIYSPDTRVQEIYSWENADVYYRTLNLRRAANAILPGIKKTIRVYVETGQDIKVTVTSTIDPLDKWTARYRRVSDAHLAGFFAQQHDGPSSATPELFALEGLYQSDKGHEIIFESPRYTWIREDDTLGGGFVLFPLDVPVLSILIVDPSGRREDDKSFIIEQTMDVSQDRIIRSFSLTPARLTVFGAVATSEDELHFSQIETVEKEEREDSGPTAVSR